MQSDMKLIEWYETVLPILQKMVGTSVFRSVVPGGIHRSSL